MAALLCFLLTLLASPFKSKSRLEAENAALRQQLIVLQRRGCGRVREGQEDRILKAFRSVHNLMEMAERPYTLSLLVKEVAQIEHWKAEGKRVTEIRRVGKRIVFVLEGPLYLVLHLMIAGRLRWRERGIL